MVHNKWNFFRGRAFTKKVSNQPPSTLLLFSVVQTYPDLAANELWFSSKQIRLFSSGPLPSTSPWSDWRNRKIAVPLLHTVLEPGRILRPGPGTVRILDFRPGPTQNEIWAHSFWFKTEINHILKKSWSEQRNQNIDFVDKKCAWLAAYWTAPQPMQACSSLCRCTEPGLKFSKILFYLMQISRPFM